MPEPPHAAEQFKSLGRIYQLVSEFVAPIVLGLLLDIWLVKSAPWGTVIGVLVGMLLGGYGVVRLVRQLDKPNHGAKGASGP